MSQALTLYRLQQIDNSIDRAQARLDIIRTSLEDDAAIQQAKALAVEKEASHKAIEVALSKSEHEVQDIRIKIEQTEASLYGGSVRTPKELRDLQEESAALKRFLTVLEDRLLENMLAAEKSEKENEEAQVALTSLNRNKANENEALIQEDGKLKREIQKLTTERLAITETLSKESHDLYENLRLQRRGVAVTVVEENTCASCGTTLTPAMVQAARSTGAINHCPSCGRILFAS